MRLNTMIGLIHNATTGRLHRLLLRLQPTPGNVLRPRDGVRHLWVIFVADVLTDRQRDGITDN